MVNGATGLGNSKRRLHDGRKLHAGAMFAVGATALAAQLAFGQAAIAQQRPDTANAKQVVDSAKTSRQTENAVTPATPVGVHY